MIPPATPPPLPSVAGDAIHIAAFLGDTNGNGPTATQDVTLEQRVIGQANNGFPAYPYVRSRVDWGHQLNGLIQANDTTSIQRAHWL